jgi:hypothetical protein
MRIEKYGNTRYWAVVDTIGTLVCLCVYRKGAVEVIRCLQALEKGFARTTVDPQEEGDRRRNSGDLP